MNFFLGLYLEIEILYKIVMETFETLLETGPKAIKMLCPVDPFECFWRNLRVPRQAAHTQKD